MRPAPAPGPRRSAAALATAALLLAPAAAHAVPSEGLHIDNLPDLTEAEVEASVHDLDLSTGDISLDDTIRELEERSSEGSTTVVTLSSDILFAFGKADLSAQAEKRIRDLLKKVPQRAKLSIDGHTDNVGDDSSNQELSEDRAEAVAEVVEDERSDLRLTVKGHGEKDPVASNGTSQKDDPVGRSKNRRVELRYDR